LAKQYHPDINPSEQAREKFAKINSAYETLHDQEKRRVYDATGATADEQSEQDQHGENPFTSGKKGRGDPNVSNLYEEFEKMFSEDYGHGGGRRTTTQKKGNDKSSKRTGGEDIVLGMEIDFMDAVKGCEKSVTFNRSDVCLTCKGQRTKPGTSPAKCGLCGGSGF